MRRTSLLLALPAVLAVGCGGSSSLSAGALRSQANAICTKVNEETAATVKTNDFDTAVNEAEAGVRKLDALKPPSSLKTSYQAYLGKLDASIPVIRKAVGAIDAKDQATARLFAQDAAAINKQVVQAARRVGLTQCARGS
jgi:hypothetical protein